MDRDRPVGSGGFIEIVGTVDGMVLEHRRKGKIYDKRHISDIKETNLLTKVVKMKKGV
uniref:Uncharacterized protein n=1 Tax=viral metagenome TaxID=1070528 RepID=A0A6M3JY60_9ZZZZ